MIFKDYQKEMLRILWGSNKNLSSRDVWLKVNDLLGLSPETRGSISRASVINFLNAMVDETVCDFTETTGKGGHRRLYAAVMTEPQLWDHITETVEKKLSAARGG